MRSTFQCSKAYRAFSLIEAAIVLGIIGLVIGGIWAATASVQEKNRRNLAFNAMMECIEWFNEAYQNIPLKAASNQVEYLTDTVYKSGLLRNFQPLDPPTNSTLNGPWPNSAFLVFRWDPFGTLTTAYISLVGVSYGGCQEIVRRFATLKLEKLRIYQVNNTAIAQLSDGISTAEMTSLCGTGANTAVQVLLQ